MTLPPKIVTKKNRTKRWISPAHCSFVRKHHCSVPGCKGMPIEVMHVRAGTDAGMGKKPSDYWTISGCRDHHDEQHRIGEASFESKYGINMKEIAEAFAKASPKWPEIKQAKDAL